ncbi:MAG: hypothetical protein U5K37_00760 [Natrialbaceae archaeon]|nr:hypothetical protein [Natrialbaceae archaeon]
MADIDLTQAELFDVFSNARRRQAVRYLKEQNGSCDLEPLVENVAAWENAVNPEEVTRTQRRRVYISLYQTHLPMLEDSDIIEWNPNDHFIRLTVDEEVFEPYLKNSPTYHGVWHILYGSVVGIGIVLLVLSWVSIGPLNAGTIPGIVVALCGILLGIAVIHTISRRRRTRAIRSTSTD